MFAKLRKHWTIVGPCGLVAAIFLLWLATIPPLLPSRDGVVSKWRPSESWLYDRNGELLDSIRVDYHVRRLGWVGLGNIAKPVQDQLIASEDKRFFDHGGVDWLAMGSAIRARLNGEPSRGASTLSMQLAAFLVPELAEPGKRNWLDKFRQMRAAIALESDWSKDEILEAYLNLASFRGETQGIGAAANGFFGKAPDALNQQDAILLAAMLPSPNASGEALGRRACRIAPAQCVLLQSAAKGLTASGRQVVLDPGLAPHLSIKLLTDPGIEVKTRLDKRTQIIASAALRRQLLGLGSERARDGAVIVVDNGTGDVLAYVGGVGGDSTAAAVDGASAYRQAGSTLKPFLYAQAMERGYLTTASILDDSPVQLDTATGLYVPQNYDKGFKGPVSVRTALASSLNVPAVRTLLLTGTEAFRDRLWDSGYHGLTEDGQYYGFSLALGSAEVTLLEQAAAYRSLALGGDWSPLRIKAHEKAQPLRRVMSKEASWMVSDILADPTARATTFGLDSALKLPFWAAAKTGTSKAMRDNWCIGYTDRYTVAVWVGNLEGDSMKAVSGTSGAAPVWREIMLALHANSPGRASEPPATIEQLHVTFADGIEAPRTDYFLKGMGQGNQSPTPAESKRPRITNPVSGSVFAFDPDIPADRQKLGISVSGSLAGHRLNLNNHDIGAADANPQLPIIKGIHQLALLDPSGKQVDQIRFTIR